MTVERTFELAPSSQVPFLASVLQRAQTLPSPPRVTIVAEASSGKGAHVTFVRLEWADAGFLTEAEVDFARWVNGLYDHLKAASGAVN